MAETFATIQAEIDSVKGQRKVTSAQLIRYVKALTAGGGLYLPSVGNGDPYQIVVPGNSWVPLLCWTASGADDGVDGSGLAGLVVESGGDGYWAADYHLQVSTTAQVEFGIRQTRGGSSSVTGESGWQVSQRGTVSGRLIPRLPAATYQWLEGDVIDVVVRGAATVSIYSGQFWAQRVRAAS